ncbi:Uncharacterised protein [Serratia fonticola]|uniref:Uncharacterized protein n=1 Tax=Serratia fonticola TaxID=47917 RepID=A0A4U9TVI8_SERFO|nr:Uncharacterised protein [Serratia fonticola]
MRVITISYQGAIKNGKKIFILGIREARFALRNVRPRTFLMTTQESLLLSITCIASYALPGVMRINYLFTDSKNKRAIVSDLS